VIDARVDPRQFDVIPIVRTILNMGQRDMQRGRGIGADRAIEGSPIGQRVGERANAYEADFAHPHDQGKDADRASRGVNHQHTQFLVGAEVLPVNEQPVERLKEAGGTGLAQQLGPHETQLC
jgi:hypothetical protein